VHLSLASAESLLTWAERLGQRVFGLPPTLTLLGTSVPGGRLTDLVLMGLLVGVLALGLTLFLETDLGLAMRATGNNPQMAKAVGIEVDRKVVLGLGLSNGLIALSGGLFAQYQGFANIQMGVGMFVTGVATRMVGEALLGKRPLGRWLAGVVAGAVVFRLLLALAVRAGLNPNALKLVTALFVLAVLVLPELARRSATGARRKAYRAVPERPSAEALSQVFHAGTPNEVHASTPSIWSSCGAASPWCSAPTDRESPAPRRHCREPAAWRRQSVPGRAGGHPLDGTAAGPPDRPGLPESAHRNRVRLTVAENLALARPARRASAAPSGSGVGSPANDPGEGGPVGDGPRGSSRYAHRVAVGWPAPGAHGVDGDDGAPGHPVAR
jgi:hypothetical protein